MLENATLSLEQLWKDTPPWLSNSGSIASLIALGVPLYFYITSLIRTAAGKRPMTLSEQIKADVKGVFAAFHFQVVPNKKDKQLHPKPHEAIPPGVTKQQPRLRMLKDINRSYSNGRSSGDVLFMTMGLCLLLAAWFITVTYFVNEGFSNPIYDAVGGLTIISIAHITFKFFMIMGDFYDARSFWASYPNLFDRDFDVGRMNLSSGYVKRRADLIRDNLDDLPSLHELVPTAASIDGERLDSGYVSLSAYVWTLPVLGFVGTARGLSEAIAGFKDGLMVQGNGGPPDLAGSITNVVSGLASAFQASVTALCATIVVYICARALKSLEQTVLDTVDSCCLDILSAIPFPGDKEQFEGRSASIIESLDRISGQLLQLVKVSAMIDKIKDDARMSTDELEQVVKALVESAGFVQNARQGISEMALSAAQTMEIANRIWEAREEQSHLNYRWDRPYSLSLPLRLGPEISSYSQSSSDSNTVMPVVEGEPIVDKGIDATQLPPPAAGGSRGRRRRNGVGAHAGLSTQ